MDELDLKLLGALGGLGSASTGPFPPELSRSSAGDVARRLRIPLQTAKDRLRRLRDSGVLLGRIIFPHPGVVGGVVQVALVRFPTDGPPGRLAPLEKADWVLGHLDAVGPLAMVQLLYRSRSELDAKLERLRRELGAVDVEMIERHVSWTLPRPLTPLDHRILVAVAEHPSDGAPELAQRLGLTPRTLRARLSRLEREGFILAFPIVDRAALEGILLPYLILRARDGRSAEAGRQARQALGAHALSDPPLPASSTLPFDLLAWARSLNELDALRRRVAACPAVEECHTFLPQEGDDRLDELVAALKAAAPTP